MIGRINYNSGLSDYSAQVTEIQNMDPKPDLIFGGFIVPEAGVFPRQMKAAGFDIPIFGTDGMDDPGVLEIGGEGASLVKFTTHGFPTEGSPLAEFYSDCSSRGYKIENIFFGLAGDAVTIIANAIETAGSAEPAAINEAIKNIENLKGITTDSITYKNRNGIPLRRMSMVEVKDGKFSLIKTLMPEYIPAP